MLTAAGCAGRRARLWAALPAGCDAILVADPSSLTWLAGYAPSPFSFRSSESMALLVLLPGRAILVADALVDPDLARAHADQVIAPTWYDFRHAARHRRAFVIAAALERLHGLAMRRIGIEASAVPCGMVGELRAAHTKLELLDVTPQVRRLRRAKDPDELAVLRRSVQACEAGHAAALAGLEPGMNELDAFALVERAASEALGEPAWVYGDFEAYPRPPGMRPPSSMRLLQNGDVFLLDFSVVVDGYRADFANTIAIGPPAPEHERILAGCLAAIAAGESQLRAGVPARQVDRAVRQALADHGLDPDAPAHVGHGLGLAHPEPPFLVPESDETLEAGDVVTLEPGQYGAQHAFRFEHNYVIRPEGHEQLTRHRIALRP